MIKGRKLFLSLRSYLALNKNVFRIFAFLFPLGAATLAYNMVLRNGPGSINSIVLLAFCSGIFTGASILRLTVIHLTWKKSILLVAAYAFIQSVLFVIFMLALSEGVFLIKFANGQCVHGPIEQCI